MTDDNPETSECGVCYDIIEDCANNLVKFECSHFLCRDCFQKLVASRCPFCRRSFGGEESPENSHDDESDEEEIYLEVNLQMSSSYPPRSRIRRRQRAILLQENNTNPNHNLGTRELWDLNYGNNNTWQMNRLLKQRTRHRHLIHLQKEIVPCDYLEEYDELVFYILSFNY